MYWATVGFSDVKIPQNKNYVAKHDLCVDKYVSKCAVIIWNQKYVINIP